MFFMGDGVVCGCVCVWCSWFLLELSGYYRG